MFIVAVIFGIAGSAFAQEGFTNDEIAFAIDNLTMFICAVLVLFMQAGFAMVEAGFNGGKNTINILFKNLMDMAIGGVLFFLFGYGIMYPGEFNGILGFAGMGVPGQDALDPSYYPHFQTDFLFQVAFAATAATIVSGAVAGRMQFRSYLIYSAAITAIANFECMSTSAAIVKQRVLDALNAAGSYRSARAIASPARRPERLS